MTTHANILDEIQALLAAPIVGDGSDVARIEHTLTTGYASALALEAERWRIERRIAEVASLLDPEDGKLHAAELAKLSARLTSTGAELTRLRGMLSSLRARADEARAA